MLDKKTFFKKLARRGATALVAIVAASIISSIFFGRLETVHQKTLAAKAQTARLANEQLLSAQLETDLANSIALAAKLDEAVPNTDNLSNFVDVMDGLAKANNFNQTALHFGQITKLQTDPDWSELEYEVSLSGKSSDLAKYLGEFEKLPYLTVIKSLSVDNETTNFKATLYVKTN